MASGIFAILDDIAMLMDDVALASKVATKKTAGILGDDLAVNADKATGFVSSRELPVLWSITKGSLLNKLIIVPIALLLNYSFPEVIKWILVLGGLYLAFEGVEKIFHWLFHRNDEHPEIGKVLSENPEEEEKSKIRSAISTDFILSVEIVIIALGTVLEQSLAVQVITVAIVSLIATVGVYGIVALIVRMDDFGFQLIKKSNGKEIWNTIGNAMVKALPVIIRILSFVGTIALILVAGGIFAHNIEMIHHFTDHHLSQIPSILSEALLGVVGGLIAFCVIFLGKKIYAAFNS